MISNNDKKAWIRTELCHKSLEHFYHFATSGSVPNLDPATVQAFSNLGVDLTSLDLDSVPIISDVKQDDNVPLRSLRPTRKKKKIRQVKCVKEESDWDNDDLYEEETSQRRKYVSRAQKRAAHPNLFHFPQTGERNGLKYQCDLCVRGFNARDSLLQHKARHTASGPHEAWTCLLCNAKFEYYRDMVKHKETTHADESLECPHCSTTFKFRKSLMNHIKVHDTALPARSKADAAIECEVCINCGKQFARKAELRLHVKKKGVYHDDHCTWTDSCPDVRFDSYRDHLEHVKEVHGGQFAFRCSFCPMAFSSLTLKRRHMKATHTITAGRDGDTHHRGEKVVCHECGANVFQCYLTKHIQTVHGEKTFSCTHEGCTSVFKCENTLKRHVKDMHTIVPCEACGKVLPLRSYQRHFLRMHTPEHEKPFKCDVCVPVRGFITTQDLKEHQNTHTQERPHVCQICSAAFRSTGNLFAHIRGTHKGIKRVKK